MNQFDFVRRRQESWEEFARLIDKWRREKQIDPATIHHVGRLYRQTAADLSMARTYFPGTSVTTYLNALVADGHSQIYGQQPIVFKRAAVFLRQVFPGVLREARLHVALAATVFSVAALLAFTAVWLQPDLANSLLPQTWLKDSLKGGDIRVSPRDMPEISGLIAVNNIQVAFSAFASGIFLGLGTIYMLVLNGLLLGALAAAFAHPGLSITFWSLILPHGILELPAIFVAAAAGLMLGDALLRPGDPSRRAALGVAAKKAVILIGGVIPVFIVAGLIEGFFTPLPIPAAVKLAVSVAVGLVGFAYFSGLPRVKRD